MKLILTRELGRLSKWLRILGYDTEYLTEGKISSVIIEALRQDRIVLTRNHRLPEAYKVKTIYIKSENINEQLALIFKELGLKIDDARMFTRCIICNVQLLSIEKEKVKDRVPEYVFATQQDFVSCPKCKRVYWQGTHWGNVKQTLDEIT